MSVCRAQTEIQTHTSTSDVLSLSCCLAEAQEEAQKAKQAWVHIIKFRWICDWCPPFMRKLKQEVDQEEQEALAEEQAQDLERRQAAAAGGGDDGGDAGTG